MARRFYYDTGEEKIGPISGEDLLRMRASGEIASDTWVRAEDSQTWRPLHSVNLKEEEEELRNPSLLKLLLRNASWQVIAMTIAIGVILIVLLAGAVSVLWPLILALLAVWFIQRLIR